MVAFRETQSVGDWIEMPKLGPSCTTRKLYCLNLIIGMHQQLYATLYQNDS